MSRTPLGNGDENGSANKSCSTKKIKHKRSDEATVRRKQKRVIKKENNRQKARVARKELKQVAPAQPSYTKAQVSPIAKMQEDRTNFFDWKNKPDKGAGISHFLWAEEKTQHQDSVQTSVDKFEKSMLQKMFDTVCEGKWKIHDKVVIKEFKIIDKIIRVAFWNTKRIAHLAARENWHIL